MTKRPTRARLTPWFPADVRPIRVGIYEMEAMAISGAWFRYFDGKHWAWGGRTPDKAYRMRNTGFLFDGYSRWRGLAKKRRPFSMLELARTLAREKAQVEGWWREGKEELLIRGEKLEVLEDRVVGLEREKADFRAARKDSHG